MTNIEMVVFDWAGTTVDYGCFAPVAAFKEAFTSYKIEVTNDEVRKPMGMLKIEHIKTMLKMPRIASVFKEVYGREYNMDDVNAIYRVFEDTLMETIVFYTEVKPYVLEVVDTLRKQGIKIGSTTGYTDSMMEHVVPKAKAQGYAPDAWFSPDSTNGIGRPFPYLIYRNMETLKVQDARKVVKFGDTVSDILEGKNAGVIAVGIIEGSSQAGYNQEEFEALNAEEKEACIQKVTSEYKAAGADYVVISFKDIPAFLETL